MCRLNGTNQCPFPSRIPEFRSGPRVASSVSVRTSRWWIGALCLTACVGKFEGESFPKVAAGKDVRVVEDVPEEARIIGVAAEVEDGYIDGSSFIQHALWCNVERRLIRRLKRTAAREGGEFLVALHCDTTEIEDDSPIHDDPETPSTETEIYCETYCTAEVARFWHHESVAR